MTDATVIPGALPPFTGPVAPGDTPARRRATWAAPFACAGLALLLSACMPSTQQSRRAAYLDCARDQGLTVRDGTIVSQSAADLARLDACQALPR